jgi:hypothetical protein
MTKAKKTEPNAAKLSVGHHSGEHIWGYEVFGDGRIQLSPGFADRFCRIVDREGGLQAMQENVNRFMLIRLTHTNSEAY